MEAIKESHSSKKRSLDCPPTPVNISTPVKKKKKEKEIVSPSDVSSNYKKKSKKKRRAEEEGFNPLSDSDEVIDSHKKKRMKEVSITYPGDEQMGKKKKKKNLTGNSENERSEAETGKSRNDTEILNQEEAVEATVSKHKDSSIITAGNNSKKRKKKKKDGSDVEGSSQEGEAPKHRKTKQASIAMATERVNSETDVAVSLETSVSSSSQKKDGNGGKSEKEEAAEEETKSEQSSSRNQRLSSTKELDLIRELEEFVPDVRNKSAHEIMKLVRYDLRRFKDFKRQGVPLRCGRYTDWENRQIHKNIADFAALTDIGSAEQVLFPQRFKEQAAEIRRLKIQHHFLQRIAEGIPRPCHQVYTRAKKIFDNRNHMGRFSEDELKSLKKLHQLHGNDWKTMSDKMDRSVYALQKRFVCLAPVHGPWSKSEESRLKQAVRDHLETVFKESLKSGLTMDQLCNNLPWKTISQKVETRHWNQCRLKWFSLLEKMTNGGFPRGPEGYQTKILIINTLFSMSVDDQADIEWDEVAHAVGNVTPMGVQRIFHRLKVTKVPNWSRMSYGDIIAFLHYHTVPALQKRLSSCRTAPDSQGLQAEVTYGLSDILSTDEDFEVDNS
ncbi:transcription termination factor 1 [Oryzias latipes]|uniref:Myb-like domain-containing protein n=1 Tax=Oryzias latipes TaxID=8090 RepID=H2MNV0_ORYLA|nr:transcription termination factor 1 [Oryzias latipes]